MILSLVTNALRLDAPASSLYYLHPEYVNRWWWREFNRISYIGGREYQRPARLTMDFDYPVLSARDANGILVSRDSDGRPIDPDTSRQAYPSMLFRHNREKSWEFENRRRRAHYHNVVSTTINSLVSHAMKKGVQRTGGEQVVSFWKACDYARKIDIDTFMREGARWAEVEGLMWACMDVAGRGAPEDAKPKTTSQRNQPDASQDGAPYVYWINPLDIFDWSVGDDGELLWVKQFIYFETARKVGEPVKQMHRFRIWYPDHVDEFDIDPGVGGQEPTTPTNTRKHTLGRVPLEPLYAKKNNECAFPDGEPIGSDLAKSANAVYNYTSLLDEILYKQTFSWLVIPDKNVDAVEIGTNTVFGYSPMGAGRGPEYISPDAAQAQVLIQAIESELARARQVFGVGQANESSKEKSSAAAMELENEDKRSILGDIVASASDFEKRLVGLFNAYRNSATDSQARVTYDTDFDLQALQDEITETLSLRSVGMSPEIMLYLRRTLAGRKLAAMPEDERQALLNTLTVANGINQPPPPTLGVDPANPTKLVDTQPGPGQGVKPDPNQADQPGKGEPPPAKRATATGAAEPG